MSDGSSSFSLVQEECTHPTVMDSVLSQHQLSIRRPGCTHMTMVRLYGPYKCFSCQQYPSQGWVYRCIQDHGPNSSESPHGRREGTTTTLKPTQGNSENKADTWSGLTLQSTVREDKLHVYTPSQVRILKKQKQDVADVIASARNSDSNTIHQLDAFFRSSPNFKRRLQFQGPIMAPTPRGKTIASARSISQYITLKCSWSCCHSCRPLLLERAWISLDAAVHQEHRPDTALEIDWPPVSDRNIVRNLGLRKPRAYSQTYQENDLKSFSDNTTEEERREHGGARKIGTSIKKAFRGMLPRRPLSDISTASVLNSRPCKQLSFEDGRTDSDLVLCMDVNYQSLGEATTIRLVKDDGPDWLDFETEAVEMESGSAVTEEGVTNVTADVLTMG